MSNVKARVGSMKRKFDRLPLSRQIQVIGGVVLGVLVGIPLRVYENLLISNNWFMSIVFGLSVSLACYLLLPITFKNTLVSEVIEENVGITNMQFLVGFALMVVAFGYQLRQSAVVVQNLMGADPSTVILGANLLLMLTLILPGYLIIPITEQEILDDERASKRAQLLDTEFQVVKAEADYAKHLLEEKGKMATALRLRLETEPLPPEAIARLVDRAMTHSLPESGSGANHPRLPGGPRALPALSDEEIREMQRRLLEE